MAYLIVDKILYKSGRIDNNSIYFANNRYSAHEFNFVSLFRIILISVFDILSIIAGVAFQNSYGVLAGKYF